MEKFIPINPFEDMGPLVTSRYRAILNDMAWQINRLDDESPEILFDVEEIEQTGASSGHIELVLQTAVEISPYKWSYPWVRGKVLADGTIVPDENSELSSDSDGWLPALNDYEQSNTSSQWGFGNPVQDGNGNMAEPLVIPAGNGFVARIATDDEGNKRPYFTASNAVQLTCP